MTGTWRDTLFVWEGAIEKAESGEKKKAQSPVQLLAWTGSWVGCEDCPDARSAITPSAAAFRDSEMKFEVSSNKEKKKGKTTLHVYEMTGGGWDLGEGDEKERHQDFQHEIATQIDLLLLESEPNDAKLEETGRLLVVATGNNNFGDFISAGYLTLTVNNKNASGTDANNKHCYRLTLGRRYLDAGDKRASWSVETLYQKIAEENDDSTAICSQPPWANDLLQAEKMTALPRKRKR